MVYVLNKNGKPLMPTTQYAKVRILLKTKRARVVGTKPFTIKLCYETANNVQPVRLGIDPGRTNIGLASINESCQCLYLAQVTTRNKEIPVLMKNRKQFRQQHRKLRRRDKRRRRAVANNTAKSTVITRVLPQCKTPIMCHDIKNKEARFNNRKRPNGWLTPTANHLLQTHLNVVDKVTQILPISDIAIELNKFSFMAMDNPNVRVWEYSKGPLYNKGSMHNAVSEQQQHHCIFCNKFIDNYHHVVPKSKGGSDTMDNIAGLCDKHHDLVHKNQDWTDKLALKKSGLNKKYGALSVLNQIMPQLIDSLCHKYPGHVFIINGQDTYQFRNDNNIPKDHWLDAYCVACATLSNTKVSTPTEKPFEIRQFRRHDRQACIRQNINRRYILNGAIVAINRHKPMEQKTGSLAEYRLTHFEQDISKLSVKPHHAHYKDMTRLMPGAVLLDEDRFVLTANASTYYIDKSGSKHKMRSCKIIKHNTGLVYC